MIEPKPDGVGVKESMFLDVLESGGVGLRTLRGFSKQKSAGPTGEVAAFFVRRRSFGDFHQERLVGFSEEGQQLQIERC